MLIHVDTAESNDTIGTGYWLSMTPWHPFLHFPGGKFSQGVGITLRRSSKYGDDVTGRSSGLARYGFEVFALRRVVCGFMSNVDHGHELAKTRRL